MMKDWQVDAFFVEEGVSGSTPLADRPEGRRLLAAISKGDVVVIAKLDRGFRSAADALTVLEELKAQGVSLHIIDLGGDVTGNGISKMVFTILARSPRASAIGSVSAFATPSGTWRRKACLAAAIGHSVTTSCWTARSAGLSRTSQRWMWSGACRPCVATARRIGRLSR